MKEINYTLIADGSSDNALLSIIKWLLDNLYPTIPNKGAYADFRGIRNPPPKGDIPGQIEAAKIYYPFHILFYHRDAETTRTGSVEVRKNEILRDLAEAIRDKIICVVPVKMMETWLLIDEEAIKKAAGNRNYSDRIGLPKLQSLENLTQPKEFLHELLKRVGGRKGRNLKRFNVHEAVHLVAENIEDFSPLRNLEAFALFEQDVKTILEKEN